MPISTTAPCLDNRDKEMVTEITSKICHHDNLRPGGNVAKVHGVSSQLISDPANFTSDYEIRNR